MVDLDAEPDENEDDEARAAADDAAPDDGDDAHAATGAAERVDEAKSAAGGDGPGDGVGDAGPVVGYEAEVTAGSADALERDRMRAVADDGEPDEPDEPGEDDEAGDGDGAGVVGQPREGEGFRSGFVTLVGRPNVGKSTLLNQILGHKVAIVSDKPQTTRHRIQGVLNRPGVQVVFVDTPGIHKPRTALGERLNDTARATITDVDVVVFVVDATQAFGRGDAWVADKLPSSAVVVVNKIDRASRSDVLAQLGRAGELDMAAYFPVSARTGEGVAALVDHLVDLLPEGPRYFPEDTVTDVPEAFWVAELVREQLLAVARDELPHSIATRVTEWDWPYVRCEILVERPSQKGIVLGHQGERIKEVGTAVREQMPEGAYLDLHVKVDRNWQRKPAALDRLGF